MNAVERVKNICKERKIAISKLEKDCGFANGYIGQLKKGTFPNDRLFIIAKYLDVSENFISNGTEELIQIDEDVVVDIMSNARIMEYAKRLMMLSETSQQTICDNIDFLLKKEGRD